MMETQTILWIAGLTVLIGGVISSIVASRIPPKKVTLPATHWRDPGREVKLDRPWALALFVISAALAGVGIVIGAAGLAGVSGAHECRSKVHGLGESAHWSYVAGCQVVMGDRLVPFDQYRNLHAHFRRVLVGRPA